jgi:hypothetical protein
MKSKKLYALDLRGIKNIENEFDPEMIKWLEESEIPYTSGFYYERMLEIDGFTNNANPIYNLRENETLNDLYARIVNRDLRVELLDPNRGWPMTEKGREFILNAPHGFMEKE